MCNYQFAFFPFSQNKKTGNMPQTYTSKGSCSGSCSMADICYAKIGPTNLHWENANLTLEELAARIKKLRDGSLIRHNVAGDMSEGNGSPVLDAQLVDVLTNKVFKRMRAYTYTHCSINIQHNREVVAKACKKGFTINFSCETLEQVKKASENNVPCVLTVRTMQKDTTVIDGITFKKCLYQTKGMTCVECQRCRMPNRKYVVVFEEHSKAAKAKKEAVKLLNI